MPSARRTCWPRSSHRPLGSPLLQLKDVELLTILAKGRPHAAEALCASDLTAFGIELCRRDGSAADDAAAAAAVRLAARELLLVLLPAARPHQGQGPTAGSICVRLVDAFYARSASSTAHQPPPSSSQQQGSFGGGSAAAAADEHEDAVALACLEAKCICALLSWHQPAAPRETGRLTGFCAHTLPTLLAPLLHDAEVLGEADDEVAMMAISAASALLASCATALVSCDAAASDELAKLICSDHIRRALHHVRLEEAQADLATAMSAILCAPCLSVPRKRAFALEMAKPALGLLRQMSDATHDVPGSVEAHRGSHLAASLLRGLCRLPAAWLATQDGEAAINTMPAGLTACINDLCDSRPIETTTLEPSFLILSSFYCAYSTAASSRRHQVLAAALPPPLTETARFQTLTRVPASTLSHTT